MRRANLEKGMEWEQIWKAADFWKRNRDSYQIAALLFVHESVIYNHLSLIRKSASDAQGMGEMI